MARQFQIPGGSFVNIADETRQYQIPGFGYLVITYTATGRRYRIVLCM